MATQPPPPAAHGPDVRAALRELPLFPLPQVVLFPGAVMPLHVFEPRYRQMTRDVLDTHRVMAVVQIQSQGDAAGLPVIARVAGVGAVIEAHELPDGRFNIILEGRGRVHLNELPFVPPYRRARAELLEDLPGSVPEAELQSLIAVATAFTSLVQSRDPSFAFSLPQSLPAARLADLCAHHLVLDSRERQKILETLDPVGRVKLVSESLATQLAMLKRERNTMN